MLKHLRVLENAALLETRKNGRIRRCGIRATPMRAAQRYLDDSQLVRNIVADPRVWVRVRGRWYTGTAQLLPDDDPRERLKRRPDARPGFDRRGPQRSAEDNAGAGSCHEHQSPGFLCAPPRPPRSIFGLSRFANALQEEHISAPIHAGKGTRACDRSAGC